MAGLDNVGTDREEWDAAVDDSFSLHPLKGRPGEYRTVFHDGSWCDGWVPAHT